MAKHWNRWTLGRKGAVLVAAPAVFQIFFVLALIAIERGHDRERDAELLARDAVASAHRVQGLLVDSETALRGYALTNDRSFAEPYEKAIAVLGSEQERLQSLASRERLPFPDLETPAAAVTAYHRRNVEMLDRGQRDLVVQSIARHEGKQRMDTYRSAIARFLALERAEEMERRRRVVAARRRIHVALATASAVQLTLAASLAFFFTTNISGRIEHVLQNMERLARGETLRQGVGGADEIARLDEQFHAMAAALDRGRAELQTANAGLESFSYSVSHDLRAPIRAIDGYARILQEDYGKALEGEGARYLGVIRSESHRMAMLIDDLLAFARLGRQALTPVPIDVRQLAIDAMHEVRNGIEVSFKANDAPPALADRATLKQVLINLLSNATKYSKRGDPACIEFGGRSDGSRNVYWVRDNGIGFDMQYASKLFGVFQRLHADPAIEGTGVGLAIVHRIVARHGGEVWAEGKEGHGATFFFSLPSVSEAQHG
jgi:signal transduction histidine kinase